MHRAPRDALDSANYHTILLQDLVGRLLLLSSREFIQLILRSLGPITTYHPGDVRCSLRMQYATSGNTTANNRPVGLVADGPRNESE